jgi:hypothetical protein
MIVRVMEGWVASNKTETEVEHLLIQLCDLLPKSWRPTCDKMVVNDVPKIVAFLEKDFTPTRICQLIGMCPAASQTIAVSAKKVSGIECEACAIIVKSIESWIAEGKTEDEIASLLEQLCTILPSSFQPVCDDIVKKGIATIIALLEKKWTPERVCAAMKMCVSSPQSANAMFLVEQSAHDFLTAKMSISDMKVKLNELCKLIPDNYKVDCTNYVERTNFVMMQHYILNNPKAYAVRSDLACTMCEQVMTGLKDWLATYAGNQLDVYIEKMCANLGNTFSGVCKAVAEGLVSKLEDYVKNQLTAQQLCVAIQLCTSS